MPSESEVCVHTSWRYPHIPATSLPRSFQGDPDRSQNLHCWCQWQAKDNLDRPTQTCSPGLDTPKPYNWTQTSTTTYKVTTTPTQSQCNKPHFHNQVTVQPLWTTDQITTTVQLGSGGSGVADSTNVENLTDYCVVCLYVLFMIYSCEVYVSDMYRCVLLLLKKEVGLPPQEYNVANMHDCLWIQC